MGTFIQHSGLLLSVMRIRGLKRFASGAIEVIEREIQGYEDENSNMGIK